jgi:hypothetical protein
MLQVNVTIDVRGLVEIRMELRITKLSSLLFQEVDE